MFRRVGLLLLIAACTACAQQLSPDDRAAMEQELQALRKRIDDLELRLKASEAKPAKPEAPAPGPALVTADTTGFNIKSADGNFTLKVGADLQVDNHATFTGGESSPDSILLRRIRPTFSGTVYKYVDYFFRPDFGLGQTIIYDGYIQLNYIPHLNLRVGKFKPPVGLERLQTDDDTSFIERGLPTLLVPSRDIGYQLSADFLHRKVTLQAGVFNGVVDNGLSDTATSGHRDFAGRVFLNPINGLGIGIGATTGSVDGELLPAYKTVGLNAFFNFAPGVVEAGHRTRLAPQAYYYLGPLGLLAEYGVNKEGLQRATDRQNITFRAWQVAASYILTGEKKGFVSPTPRHSFDPLNNSWGAFELAARTGEFRADSAVFSNAFASAANSPRQAREFVGGVNWYLNRLVRISADYGSTTFAGGAGTANRIAERVLLFRFQINFI